MKCGAFCATWLCEGMFFVLVLGYVFLNFPCKGWMSGAEIVNWRWTMFDVVRTVWVLFSRNVITSRGT